MMGISKLFSRHKLHHCCNNSSDYATNSNAYMLHVICSMQLHFECYLRCSFVEQTGDMFNCSIVKSKQRGVYSIVDAISVLNSNHNNDNLLLLEY